jgi:phenylpyruvate tautomerase PptA (4-oxalocrotonate tautomerase family)
MPLARITLLKGKPTDYRAGVSRAVHDTLVETYGMDPRDQFQIFEEVEPGRLVFSPDYAGGPRSDDFMIVAIASMPRTADMKAAFHRRLVERLSQNPGVRPQDVFVLLSDGLALDDISFANGVSAAELARRYAPAEA